MIPKSTSDMKIPEKRGGLGGQGRKSGGSIPMRKKPHGCGRPTMAAAAAAAAAPASPAVALEASLAAADIFNQTKGEIDDVKTSQRAGMTLSMLNTGRYLWIL